jgi:hypothetical protein
VVIVVAAAAITVAARFIAGFVDDAVLTSAITRCLNFRIGCIAEWTDTSTRKLRKYIIVLSCGQLNTASVFSLSFTVFHHFISRSSYWIIIFRCFKNPQRPALDYILAAMHLHRLSLVARWHRFRCAQSRITQHAQDARAWGPIDWALEFRQMPRPTILETARYMCFPSVSVCAIGIELVARYDIYAV